MKKAIIIKRLKELINDQHENIQYADDDEKKWRNECIIALKECIKIMDVKD